MSDLSYYFVYILVLLSIYMGSRTRRFSNDFFRMLLLQVIVFGLMIIATNVLSAYNTFHNTQISNRSILNVHVGIEAILLFKAAFYFLKSTLEKRIAQSLFGIFVFTWLFQLIYLGLGSLNDTADLMACITLTLVYSMVLFKCIKMNRGKWWASPEILTIIGMLAYFAGSVPFVSMMSYLSKNEPKLYFLLFNIINSGLANTRYLLLFISFFLIYRTKGKTQLQFA